MLPRPKLLAVTTLVCALLVGATIVLTAPAPQTLPIEQGTILHVSNYSFAISFTVDGAGAHVTGAYYTDSGLTLAYAPPGTDGGTWIHSCPSFQVHGKAPANVTIDWSLQPGQYVLVPWCGPVPANLTVTQTIRVVYGS